AEQWAAAGRSVLPGYAPWDGRDQTLGLLPPTQEALAPGWLGAPNGNSVIGVAGLLTNSGSTPLPLDLLGWSSDMITYLSHAGVDPEGLPLPYGAADTFLGVDRSARLLADELRRQWILRPGVAVDLVGHSFGGVVVMHYLLTLHDPADPTLPPIGHVVTLSAPLEGADLASAAANPVAVVPLIDPVLALAALVLGGDVAGQSMADLVVGSPLLAQLAAAWSGAQADPHRSPLATGTRVLTVGGSRDAVVPDHRADLPGADHVIVPGGHTAMHESEAVLQVVRAFLAHAELPAGDSGWGAWLSGGWTVLQQSLGIVF
ncbi:MAG: pimeloyl-ACP methyl ester carboxylesterase, partial [Glaciecola sp.]